MAQPRILVFAGSARALSYNKRLARLAGAAARKAGADVTLIDLADFSLPLYDGDLEAAHGIPAAGRELRRLFREHAGLIIASPEYNHSFSPLLKNTIDWVSRQAGDENYKTFFAGKAVLLTATSPGNSGGARGLPHLRQVLSHLGAQVLEQQITIGQYRTAFAEDGTLVDALHNAQLEVATSELVARIAGQSVSALNADVG